MRRMQNKILILVSSSIIISAVVVMMIAFFNYSRIVEDDIEQIMQLMCSEKRQAIDEKLLNIEQGVHTLYQFAVNQINETDNVWQDEEEFEEHISRMNALIKTTAQYTDGAVSVYYRLDSNIKGPKQGIWLVQNENGDFVENEMTDVSMYDRDDIEHVGWYYIPIDNEKETWMNPYYNQNMDEEIISYVIPIILEGEVIGVVGMDIATSLLYENTKMVKVYETGYAFLMDNEGRFVYHPEMSGNTITTDFNNSHMYLYEKSSLSAEKQSVEEYQWNGIDKKLTAQKLLNGMIFTVCVTENEIKQPQIKMMLHTIVVILFVLLVFVFVTVSITKVIIKLMYTDSMTRVGNKKAYTDCIDVISKKIANKEKFNFAVIVTDINNLKKVNDTYGHEYGDLLIENGVTALKKIWDSRYIYRIGGDEFVVIYLDTTKETVEKEIIALDEIVCGMNEQNDSKILCLQMAVGMAVYDAESDMEYMDVFRRADSAMYENKKNKKNKKEYNR